MKKICILLLSFLLWSQTGIGLAGADRPVLTLMTHDSFAISEELMKRFESQHGVTVKILKSGDAGAALNQAILSKANPLADVFYGVDNTFLSRALKANIFKPYVSPLLEKIPGELKLDPENRLVPVDFGDVCLNYDIDWFARKGISPPRDLPDLVKTAYKGLTVVQNPATSSPGLAFLLTTVGRFGEDGYLAFWKKLRDNDVHVSAGWSDAYYGQFSRAKGGTRPIVVSYASSPPAEVFYSEKKPDKAPTAAVLAPRSAFRQIEFAGIFKGTKHPRLAQKMIDFMLNAEFQQEIPLKMWVFPANPRVPLPEVFAKFTRKAEDPVYLSPQAIEQGREKWIDAWTDVVLR